VSEVGSAFLDSALRLLTASSGALLLVDEERDA
jgi:hypothetical protein